MMKDDLNYIDEFYKSALLDVKMEADSSVWKNIWWMLFWMRYKWFLLSGFAILLIGLTTYMFFYEPLPSISNGVKTYSQDTKVLTSKPSFNNKTAYDYLKVHDVIKNRIPDKSNNHILNTTAAENKKLTVVADESSNGVKTGLTKTSFTAKHNHCFLKYLVPDINLSNFSDTLMLGENRRMSINQPEVLKQSRFSLNVFAGTGWSNSSLSGVNNEYIYFRNNHESGALGWRAGVNVQYNLKNWIFETGLNYSVYRLYRDYRYTYNIYDPENSHYDYDTTFVWIYDPPHIGTPYIKNIDSTWVKVYNKVVDDHSGYNNMKYFEIPFLIGYRFKLGYVLLELKTGISTGFLTGSSYYVPLNPYSCVIAEKSAQINKVMFNYLANITLYYRVNTKYSVFISPDYRQNLKSVFKDDFPAHEQLGTFGLNLGISYRF